VLDAACPQCGSVRKPIIMPTQQGSFRLFRIAGVEVFLHWSWFLIAAWETTALGRRYVSPIWGAVEYLALFLIVLLHEFGHALACRQTGGRADKIVLWPLGGLAFVEPPPRAAAMLWSIAAGPLVNVALVPIINFIAIAGRHAGWSITAPDAARLITAIWFINLALLVFNLLPIYPLDGGQILRALLWFPFGEIRSLKIASIVGIAGSVTLLATAFWWQAIWIGIMAAFLLSRAAYGLRYARALAEGATIVVPEPELPEKKTML
jgi:Zn-dependent protease